MGTAASAQRLHQRLLDARKHLADIRSDPDPANDVRFPPTKHISALAGEIHATHPTDTSPRTKSYLPDVWRGGVNPDSTLPVHRVGKHHRNRAGNKVPSTIARLFAEARAVREADDAENRNYLARLQALRAVSALTSRPHTTPSLSATDTTLTESDTVRPATSSSLEARRPDQRTTELRLPALKENTMKSLSEGAAQQIREAGLGALDRLAERQAGIEYRRYGEALLDAAEAGACSEIRRLLDSKANVEYFDEEGFTPLIFAACNGWADAVRMLLDGKADPEYTSPDGSSALHVAAQDGHTSVFELIVSSTRFCDASALNDFLNRNIDIHPLFLAVRQGQVDVIGALVACKVTIDVRSCDGSSAFDIAVMTGQPEMVKSLFDLNVPATEHTMGEYNLPRILEAARSGNVESIADALQASSDDAANRVPSPIINSVNYGTGQHDSVAMGVNTSDGTQLVGGATESTLTCPDVATLETAAKAIVQRATSPRPSSQERTGSPRASKKTIEGLFAGVDAPIATAAAPKTGPTKRS